MLVAIIKIRNPKAQRDFDEGDICLRRLANVDFHQCYVCFTSHFGIDQNDSKSTVAHWHPSLHTQVFGRSGGSFAAQCATLQEWLA